MPSRFAVIAVFALAACKGSSEAPAPAPGSAAPGSAAKPVDQGPLPPGTAELCHRALDALKATPCKDPGFLAARASLQTTMRTLGHGTGTDAAAYDLVCARMLAAIEHDAKSHDCTIAIDAELRQRMTATLTPYFAIRTQVAPTGDATADAALRQLAVLRDEACACTDQACFDGLNGKIGDLGLEKASDEAKKLGGKLLDDMLRCQERVKLQ